MMGLLDGYKIGGPSLFDAVDTPFGGQGAQEKPQGGGFNGEDFINMLIRAAALAQGDYGGAAQISQNIGARARAEAEAAAEEARWRDRQTWKWDNEPKEAPAPYRTEDNVGNVWEIGPDGKRRLLFADDTPKYYVQGDQAIQIPNQYASGASQGGGQAGGVQEGATATNPQTGEKLMFRGGQWVPAGGGASNGTGGFQF